MKPESLLPHSQQPTTGIYTARVQSTSQIRQNQIVPVFN
jgi:hypothetical protein